MAFINEYIPREDVEKYRLEEIDKHFFPGTRARDWTIDRARDIYLRNVELGGGSDPDLRSQTKWTFYWRDKSLTLRLDSLDGSGRHGEPGWSHWLLVWVNGSDGLPASLKVHKAEFLTDFKEALTAYQGGGVYSANYTDYSATLDIAEECVL
jgi:hypothetical protein